MWRRALPKSCAGRCCRSYANPLAKERRRRVYPFEGIQVVATHLQNGGIQSARRAFNGLDHLDVRLWNAGIAAFAEHSCVAALATFRQMLCEGVAPDRRTFATILKQPLQLAQGKLVEALCSESGMLSDPLVGDCILNMYGKCRSLGDARRVFEGMEVKTVVAWTAVIRLLSELRYYSEAMRLFQQAQLEGVVMDKPFFLIVLSACTQGLDLTNGTLVHGILRECGLETELLVGNSLANMYGTWGDVDKARQVFENLEERNVVSWNIILAACAKQRHYCRQAIFMFQQMQLEGTKAEPATFLAALEACAASEDVTVGRRIHNSIKETVLKFHVQTAVMNMYGKFGCLDEASRVFEALQEQQTVSWNGIISAHAQHGYLREAVHLFRRMQLQGVLANHATFLSLLSGCAVQEALPEGELIHNYIRETEFAVDPVVKTAVINMYSRCGKLDAAYEMFEDIDAVSSTTVWASVKYGYYSQALYFLRQMQLSGVRHNLNTLVSCLNACTCREALKDGVAIHSWIAECGWERNMIVTTALFTMYGKCSTLDSARIIFEEMPEKDLVSWNTMLTLYNSYGQKDGAIQMFRRMQLEGMLLNRFTLTIMLPALYTQPMVELVQSMIDESEFHADEGVLTLLVSTFGSIGKLREARRTFDMIKHPSVASWTAIISANVEQDNSKEAVRLFRRMQLEGATPNSSTVSSLVGESSLADVELIHASIRHTHLEMDSGVCNALIQTYGGYGRIQDARNLFERIPEKTPMSWSSLIEAYLEHGPEEEGLLLYQRMLLEGMAPDPVIFVAALGICASLASLRHGRAVHAQVLEAGLEMELFIATALVNMFGKCGVLERAQVVFDKVTERDVIIWNAMMASYAQHGTCEQVLKLLRLMEQDGIKAVKTTFISVLTALSHAGLLEKASDYFSLMTIEYEIAPSLEHYGCMVDLLGRAGKVEAAESLIRKSSSEGASRLWITLLSSCKAPDDVHRGKRAAKNAAVLDPKNSASYVGLSNMYACMEDQESII